MNFTTHEDQTVKKKKISHVYGGTLLKSEKITQSDCPENSNFI